MKVIINADDLGHSEATNLRIFELILRGKVTSASLLANGAAFDDAVARVRDFAQCSFGVHLNLTEGRPLTGHPALRALLNVDGSFNGDAIRHMPISKTLHRAVLEEWTAQVERTLEHGVPVSHFDSHHHIHTVPGLFIALKELQKRFGIRKTRITMNIYPPEKPCPLLKRLSKILWTFALRRCYRTKTTEGFTSLEDFVTASSISIPPCHSVELMVHPGAQGREKEEKLLSGNWWESLPFEIERISYHDL